MTDQKATELAWVAESLEDLAIVLRELHGLDDIADQLDLARERLENCPPPTSRWKKIKFGDRRRVDVPQAQPRLIAKL
jgi:hypothetical protein